jgi:hypothetical protein
MRLKDLTPQWLIKNHFWGMYKIDEETGDYYLANPKDPDDRLPESVIQEAIDSSIARLEGTINAKIRFREHIVAYHDYDQDLFNEFGFIELDNYPVVEIHSYKFQYGEQGHEIWDVPSDLIQIKGSGSKFGTVEILPFRGIPITSSYDPALVPFITGMFSSPKSPSMVRIEYDAGMDGMPNDLEDDLVRAIGLMAAIHPLNLLGDIIIGAGIASISTSFDGISQSVATTASAENSALSSRIREYERELLGEKGVPGLIQTIAARWRKTPLGIA